jgi:hypothetical protein
MPLHDAITAIKQARALDKMAENARELGLDYEPVLDVSLIDEGKTAAPVQEPVAKSFMVHLYNFGYKAGHHDTVEGRYIDICRQDMETYHLEDVSEWLQDMVYTTAAQPAPVQPVWIQPDHLQKAQKAPFLCRVEPHKRDDFVPLYTTPPAAQRQWVGLADEEIFSVLDNLQRKYNGPPTEDSRVVFALAIEAKLKEKNT